MFIKRSSVDEIALAMEGNLLSGAIEKHAEPEARLVKAAELLNSVAEIFDSSGMTLQAEVATALLESLAAKKKSKKKPPKKSKKPAKKKPNGATKGLNSEKMVENLKEKGWVFNADDTDHHCADDNCAMCGDMGYSKDDELIDMGEDDKFEDMLKQLRHNPGDADFEDEHDLSNPDTFSEEAIHPDYKMRDFQLEDPEYSGDDGEPYDPVYQKYDQERVPGKRYREIRHMPSRYGDD